jgi:hypothetical protein
MPDARAHRSESTPVTIFGKTYHLRGDGDPDYLAELAAEVDKRMRAVAESTGTADTLKIAILAALNLADESFSPCEAAPLWWPRNAWANWSPCSTRLSSSRVASVVLAATEGHGRTAVLRSMGERGR